MDLNQQQLLLQQQQKDVASARERVAQIQTRERPSIQELMQRGMQSLPSIQSQERAAQLYKSQKEAKVGEAEEQVSNSASEIARAREAEQALTEVQKLSAEAKTRGYYSYNITTADALKRLSSATGISYEKAKEYYEGVGEVNAPTVTTKTITIPSDVMQGMAEGKYTVKQLQDRGYTMDTIQQMGNQIRLTDIKTEKLNALLPDIQAGKYTIPQLTKMGFTQSDIQAAAHGIGQYERLQTMLPSIATQQYTIKQLQDKGYSTQEIQAAASQIKGSGMYVGSPTRPLKFSERMSLKIGNALHMNAPLGGVPAASTLEKASEQYKGTPLNILYSPFAKVSKLSTKGFEAIGVSKPQSAYFGETVGQSLLFGTMSIPLQNKPALNSYQIGRGGYIPSTVTQPKITISEVSSKIKQRFIDQRINKNLFESDKEGKFLFEQARQKSTSTRYFEAKVGENKLYIVETNKQIGVYQSPEMSGSRATYAIEISPKGKVINIYGGNAIVKSSEQAENVISKIISQRVPQQSFLQKIFKIQPKTPKAELDTLLQEGKLVKIFNAKGKTFYLTEEQANILSSEGFDLSKPQSVFKETELIERFGSSPYTKQEWLKSIKLSQSKSITTIDLVKGRIDMKFNDIYNVKTGQLKTIEKGKTVTTSYDITKPQEVKAAPEVLKKMKLFSADTTNFKNPLEFRELSTKYGVGSIQKIKAPTSNGITIKEFGENIARVNKQELAQAVKMKPIRTSSATAIASVAAKNMPVTDIQLMSLPYIVGGTGSSRYAGKGIYETSLGSGLLPKGAIKQPSLNLQVTYLDQPNILKNPLDESSMFKNPLDESSMFKTSSAEDFVSKSKLDEGLKDIQVFKFDLGLKAQQRTTSQQQFKTASMLDYNQMGKTPSLPRTSTMKLFGKRKTELRLFGKAYEVQVKRRGSFRTIGLGLPKGRALMLGARTTASTLAQTFRLVPRGTTSMADISYRVPSKIFTVPKRNVGGIAFVERRGMTLKRGSGEVPQIMAAKRSKRAKWF